MTIDKSDIVMTTTKESTTGVLLVHGIGEQSHRDTLLSFGQPIIDWLIQHVEVNDSQDPSQRVACEGSVSVHHPSYLNQFDPDDTPESVIVEIRQNKPQEKTQQIHSERWMLTETWWADVFDQPSFANLAKWLFMIGPWLAMSHVARRDRIDKTNKIWAYIRLFLALGIAFVVQVIVLLLSVLAIIPIPKLRSILSDFLSTLTATLGDAYVLVSSPIQKAAAIRKVLDGIEWLDAQCDSIIVIAHSQGAAIASEALRQCENKKVKKLITYGSGLSKLLLLTEIEYQNRKPKDYFSKFNLSKIIDLTRYTTPVFFILLLFMPKYITVLPGIDVTHYLHPAILEYLSKDIINSLNWIPAALVGIYLLVFIIVIFSSAKSENEGYNQRVQNLYHDITSKGIKWVNIYATNDPVSNGKMDIEDSKLFQQIEVNNRRSFFFDHTTYWSNQDEFLTNIVREIDSVEEKTETTCITKDTVANTELLKYIKLRRANHVSILSWHHRLLWLSIIIIAWYMRFDLYEVGFHMLDIINTSNLFDWADSVLDAIGMGLSSIAIYLGVNENQLQMIGPFSLGLLMIFIVGYLWHLLFMYLWVEYDEYQGRTSPLFCLYWLNYRSNKSSQRNRNVSLIRERNKQNILIFITGFPFIIALLHMYYDSFQEVWNVISNSSLTLFFISIYTMFTLGILILILGLLYIAFDFLKRKIKIRKNN